MKRPAGLVLSVTMVLLAVIMAGCAETETTTTTVTQTLPGSTVTQTSPASTVTLTVTSLPSTTSPAPTLTASAMANAGATVYSLYCDVDYCHEEWTNGGKAEFANYDLSIYKTAHGLFTFIKYYMPNNFPGSLSDEKLAEVTAFILAEFGNVPSGDVFGLGNLASFPINK
jgi:hypothetical protein